MKLYYWQYVDPRDTNCSQGGILSLLWAKLPAQRETQGYQWLPAFPANKPPVGT